MFQDNLTRQYIETNDKA